jgi:dipeptide/tripeptide permease
MGTEEQQNLPPAGWYADPEGGAGRMRYWDGAKWTEHRHEPGAGTAAGEGRRFTALHVIASVYFVLGILVAVLGGIGVIVAAIEQADNPDRFDEAEPAAVAILGAVYVAFIALTLIAASAFIRLMLSVEQSTRRTAAAVETLRHERENT